MFSFKRLKGANVKKYFNLKIIFFALFYIAAVLATPQEDLLTSASKGDSLGVRKALNAKVDVNAKDRDGETALIKASRGGYTAIVTFLIEAKAVVDAKDNFGSDRAYHRFMEWAYCYRGKIA